MITAYQIVDLNNPLSVRYHQHSINSFQPVSDLINIIPVQCVTPDTLPQLDINPTHNRTATEKAVLASHYYMIKRLAGGEKAIIMEHDAYLWPDRVETFKQQLQLIDDLSVWNCGVAIECYTLSQTAAEIFCGIIEEQLFKHQPGPMWLIHLAGDRACVKSKNQALWPLKGNDNKLCRGNSVSLSLNGRGEKYDAPVTQHVIQEAGVTIQKSNNWIYTPERNKNLYFT